MNPWLLLIIVPAVVALTLLVAWFIIIVNWPQR